MIVQIDLSLTDKQKAALNTALDNIHAYLTSNKIKTLLKVWPLLNDTQRERALDASPFFRRIVEVSERLSGRID